ncbi:MAG TPA: hypothetical protein VN606_06060 [Thermoleophilaceae bacterium]|jgi:hypothetical protein|nr:hypothetical protein [Thermoleophilaceae bacterium]
MNSERAQAYGRVMETIQDFDGTKLQADEVQVVRDAADALLFCESLEGDPVAAEALDAFHGLTDRLLENGRITSERAGRLTADLEACAPLASRR